MNFNPSYKICHEITLLFIISIIFDILLIYSYMYLFGLFPTSTGTLKINTNYVQNTYRSFGNKITMSIIKVKFPNYKWKLFYLLFSHLCNSFRSGASHCILLNFPVLSDHLPSKMEQISSVLNFKTMLLDKVCLLMLESGSY